MASGAGGGGARQERGRHTMDTEGDDGRYAGAAGVFDVGDAAEARDGPAKCAWGSQPPPSLRSSPRCLLRRRLFSNSLFLSYVPHTPLLPQ
jgi:hypothetical protein